MLIATGSTKGGCGKTTTAVCLATCAAAKGKAVLLIDGDLQQSSLYWKGNRDDDAPGAIDVYALPSNKMHTTLPRMAAMYDVVIIDVGGTKETKVLGSAMLACGKGVVRQEGGIVLIPCKPSQLDLWGLTDTLEVLDTARSFIDGGIEARILLNQLVHGTNVSGKAAEAIDNFEEVPMLQTRIHNRVAFANAIERGCGVNEIEPNGKAALEIEHLWSELCAIHETMKGAQP